MPRRPGGHSLNATGFPDRPPVKAGPAVSDFLAGVHLFSGILGALLQRERTGQGQLVEVAMLEASIMALASAVGAFMDADGGVPELGELDNTPEAVAVWSAELEQRFGGRPIAIAVEQKVGSRHRTTPEGKQQRGCQLG